MPEFLGAMLDPVALLINAVIIRILINKVGAGISMLTASIVTSALILLILSSTNDAMTASDMLIRIAAITAQAGIIEWLLKMQNDKKQRN